MLDQCHEKLSFVFACFRYSNGTFRRQLLPCGNTPSFRDGVDEYRINRYEFWFPPSFETARRHRSDGQPPIRHSICWLANLMHWILLINAQLDRKLVVQLLTLLPQTSSHH